MQANPSKGTGLAEPTDPSPAQRLGEGIARGAVVIVGLTIVSRILGLVRTLVFSQTVGASCLAMAYVTANQVPDLLYQLVLGGALTSAMVQILARSAGRADRDPAGKARVGDITSAPVTWTVIIVVPVVLVIVAAAGPIASLLSPSNSNGHCVDVVAVTDNMLRVSAPQALFYGLVVAALALGTTIGQTAVAIPLVFVTRRQRARALMMAALYQMWGQACLSSDYFGIAAPLRAVRADILTCVTAVSRRLPDQSLESWAGAGGGSDR